MGASLYIVLDNKDPGFDPFVSGKSLSRESKKLAGVTRSLGIRELMGYFSIGVDDARAEMEGLGGDPTSIEFPPEKWFAPDEGLDWVNKVKHYIKANPGSVDDAEAVLADLREYSDVLDKAKAIGAKWHLAVDY